MRTRLAVCSIIFTLSSVVMMNAGDVASFVNLGFSNDSRHFMFGFHGAEEESGRPYAEIFTIDVRANSFAPGGVKKEVFSQILQPGQGSEGAFFTLLERSGPASAKAGINHLKQGRILYILVNSAEAKDNLEFRDFNTGNHYKVKLAQKTQGKGAQARAAFHIELEVTLKDGRKVARTLGNPDRYRENVLAYRISSIIASPDESHLVFVMEKDHAARDGKSIRYMVETAPLLPASSP